MSCKCQRILSIIEDIAPRRWAEEWDNVGLLIGSMDQDINRVMVTLDINEKVVEEAVEAGVDLIVSHHPIILKPISNIRWDMSQGRMIHSLIKHGICVYACHTNLDVAPGGVNDQLVKILGLEKVEMLEENVQEPYIKLAVNVPKGHVGSVTEAMVKAGAGCIGNYSHCTFLINGIGTFKPLEGANPYIGRHDTIERVEEVKIETILKERSVSRVIKAMIKAHPYEEPAYDLFLLQNRGDVYGLGRIGYLDKPVKLIEFVKNLKKILKADNISVAGNADAMINKIALCGGSGASLVSKALFKGADALITGDVKYHEAQYALENGLILIDAGHYYTEAPIVDVLLEHLKQELEQMKIYDVQVIKSSICTNPFKMF
jgi:dinuclear metal center YbgI/SA1388 family protein